MAEWSNPVPPIPLLRSKYPKLESDAAPIPSFAIFALCAAAGTLCVTAMIYQMDRLVLKVILIFQPSFLSSEVIFGFTLLQTERQAVERMVYRTLLIIAHLSLLYPLLTVSLLSAMEGILWLTGINTLQYVSDFWVLSESFMAVDLLCYYGYMANGALMLDETRQIELFNLTNELWRCRDREGEG
jgi:hypothetical protein